MISLSNMMSSKRGSLTTGALVPKTKIKVTTPFNVVVVPSKVVVSNRPFSYCANRSLYSRNERARGALLTIKSIREHIPNSYIVLIDNSELSSNERDMFVRMSDVFFNSTEDPFLKYHTDDSPYKGGGECLQLMIGIRHILQAKVPCERIFKLTGRYTINDTFRFAQYISPDNVFKRSDEVKSRAYYFTSFFKIDRGSLGPFYKALKKVMRAFVAKDFSMFGGWQDFEVLLPIAMGKDFKEVGNLGITQHLAPSRRRWDI